MWCRTVRNLLSAYTDGELTPADACDVRNHVERCSACASELAGLQRLVSVTSAIPMEEVPNFLHERILARLAYADQPAEAATARRSPLPRTWAWAAFTVAAAAVTTGLLQNKPVRDARVPLNIPAVETVPTAETPRPATSGPVAATPRDEAESQPEAPISVPAPVTAADFARTKAAGATTDPQPLVSDSHPEPRNAAPERVASVLPGPVVERPQPAPITTTGKPAIETRASEPSLPAGSPMAKDNLMAMPGDPVVNTTGPLPTPDSLVTAEKDPTRMVGMTVEVETPGEEDEGLRAFRMFLQENSRTVPQPPTFKPRERGGRKSL